MPYISADDYRIVRRLVAPEHPTNDADLQMLRDELFSLNRQIKAFPGTGPTPEWRALVIVHDRLLATYQGAGGKGL